MRTTHLAWIMFVAACTSASSPNTDPGTDGLTCGVPGRTGVVDCQDSCSAGQYCIHDSNGFRRCHAGCASDENCEATEVCMRDAGQALGTCTPCRDVTVDSVLPHCVDPSRTGETDCQDPCQAGELCRQDSNGFRRCVLGCASDQNCASTEHCVKAAGATEGVCASCYVYGGGDHALQTRCQAAGERAVACGVFAPAELAARVAECVAAGSASEPTLSCVEHAGSDCAQVKGCFQPPALTCDDACNLAGKNCFEWLPIDVSRCIAFCDDPAQSASAKKAVVDCVSAAAEQNWFACGQCKPVP